jgi:uncharacterized membrane protein
MPPLAGIAVAALTLAAVAVYAVLAHRLTVTGDRSAWAQLFALSTVYAAAVALAWASPRRGLWIAAASGAVVLAWFVQQRVDWDPRWIYLAQHAGAHAVLAAVFGVTLRRGSQPLVTRLALAVHGTLPEPIGRYTRRVTIAWTVYFVGMAALSLGLYLAGLTHWWSLLANFATPVTIAAMFVCEYVIRRLRFPGFAHVPILDGVRAYARRRRGE